LVSTEDDSHFSTFGEYSSFLRLAGLEPNPPPKAVEVFVGKTLVLKLEDFT